ELSAVGLPSILVPYPHAADHHQLHNARVLLDAGAAMLVRDEAADARTLGTMVEELLGDTDRCARMGDVRDPRQVLDIVEGCQTVFHLAALVGIPYRYAAPESYLQTNVVGSQNIATACQRAEVERRVQMRNLRQRADGADRAGPSIAAAVAVFGEQDRRRRTGAQLSSFVRSAGSGGAPVQRLRSAAERTRGYSCCSRPTAQRRHHDPARKPGSHA
ncbi:MAG: polysaccharide biosynthesis protein, partial [Mycobacterium sp.]|nr:polysaccharide biosynthesis protein [Mycobacterium sp.]